LGWKTLINMLDLNEKNILITGASSGIGRAISIVVGKSSPSNVILCGRDVRRLEETIQASGFIPDQAKCYRFIGDFSEGHTIPDLVSFIKDLRISLDGIVFSAGIDKLMPFRFLSEKILSDLLHINTVVPVETTRQLLKNNLVNPQGSIIFISSIMGVVGQPGQVAYSISKGGLISATKALALELSKDKIRVNVITPGIVITDLTKKMFDSLTPESVDEIRKMHPLGFGKPEDVANFVSFLLSDQASWITGSTLTIDGGYSAH